MQRIVLTFSLLSLMALSGYAQNTNQMKDTVNLKNEFGIVIDNIFAQRSADVNVYNCYPWYKQIRNPYSENAQKIPKIGLAYKRYFGNSALRSKISFGSDKNTFNNKYYSRKEKNDHSLLSLSVGYELHKSFGKSLIYAGMDVFYNKYKAVIEKIYYENDNSVKTIEDIKGFGVRPLIGGKYYFTPMLSVSTEIGFAFETYNGTETSKDSGLEEDKKIKISGSRNGFGPIGQISINIHL